ncbi:hypothetical protein B7494_g2736 [Chlorociboria aeruginascens]|nr:hypothetical protein B7494_g2736 [Chlorociboria aeruginascens]
MASTTKYTSKLLNSRVLVIGGSSGIGFCVAESALEQGAIVAISSSQSTKIATAISRLQKAYPDKATNIHGYPCDLANQETLEDNIEQLLKVSAKDGKINHIVFTAGDALRVRPLSTTTVPLILQASTVRFLGPLILGKYAPSYMEVSYLSSITLTGGTNAYRPNKDWTVAAAFASGTGGTTRGLAVDLAPIRVNMVSPGAVHTELFSFIPKGLLDTTLKTFSDWSLLERVGSPEEVAEAYTSFMKNSFATGAILQVDGGRLVK